MGDRDDYFSKLEKIKKKAFFKEARKKYKSIRESSKESRKVFNSKDEIFYNGLDFVSGKRHIENKATVAAMAYDLLNYGIEKGDTSYLLTGAKMYEKLGKGAKIIPRLIRGVEAAASKKLIDERGYEKVKEFIERNTEEKESSGLEGKMSIFLLFLVGGIILSFASFSITGNAVSNLTGTTQGLSGLILIIVGLTGLFFSFRK